MSIGPRRPLRIEAAPEVTTVRGAWLSGANGFGRDMTPKLCAAIVAHERIHFLFNRHAKAPVGRVLSEVMACSGELDALSEAARRKRVENKGGEAFETRGLPPLLAPGVFAVKADLHCRRTEGAVARALLEGAFWTVGLSRPIF